MLSPHEVAALLILGSSDPSRELDPADVGALVLRELIELEGAAPNGNGGRVRVTREGRRVLNAFTRRNYALSANP
jgi:hypothetical protein